MLASTVQSLLGSFADELTKLGVAGIVAGQALKQPDPDKPQVPKEQRTWAERHGNTMLAGKMIAANAIFRHGPKLPPVQWLGKEIAGVGMRAGMAGKEMINRPTREAFALLVDPQTVSAYEASHAVGRRMKGARARDVKKTLRATGRAAEAHGIPYVSSVTDALKHIPLKAKGARKVVDGILQPKVGIGERLQQAVDKLTGRVREKPAKAAEKTRASTQKINDAIAKAEALAKQRGLSPELTKEMADKARAAGAGKAGAVVEQILDQDTPTVTKVLAGGRLKRQAGRALRKALRR